MKNKKTLLWLCVILCLLFTACGEKTPQVNITIDDITAAVQTVDPAFVFDDKPLYQLIGAKDGWMGYVNGENRSVVKVYQYEDDKAYQQALKDYEDVLSPMPKVGNFVLECSNEDVLNAFSNIQSSNGSSSENSSSQESQSGSNEILVNTTYTVENFCDFNIQHIFFTYDVLPETQNVLYKHYPADEGKVYLDIKIDVKNLQKNAMICEDFGEITLDYNNGYTYNAFAIVEDSVTGFSYANINNIDPLETATMHYLVDCPVEVYTNSYPLFLTMKVNGKTFKVVLIDQNGTTDNLSFDEAKFTDEQLKIIRDTLSTVNIEPYMILNSSPLTAQSDNEIANKIMSNCKKYEVYTSNNEAYIMIWDGNHNLVVSVSNNLESNKSELLIDNTEKLVELYYSILA